MKKSVLIFIVIAVVWVLLIALFEFTIGQIACPDICDEETGKCGCELFPNQPLRDISLNGGIPFFILILIALILNLRNPETPQNPNLS